MLCVIFLKTNIEVECVKVYATRDKNTGKYVSNLTSHRKKFWERKNACIEAVAKYNGYSWNKRDLEVVELVCVENEEYERLKEIEYRYNDLCK